MTNPSDMTWRGHERMMPSLGDAARAAGFSMDLPGPVESSVRADLDRLGRLDEGVRGSLAQMALRLARAYDLCADADLAQLARANMELRQTLSRIAEVDDDGDGDEAARMSTPVRDAADAGTADVGAAHDGGGATAG